MTCDEFNVVLDSNPWDQTTATLAAFYVHTTKCPRCLRIVKNFGTIAESNMSLQDKIEVLQGVQEVVGKLVNDDEARQMVCGAKRNAR